MFSSDWEVFLQIGNTKLFVSLADLVGIACLVFFGTYFSNRSKKLGQPFSLAGILTVVVLLLLSCFLHEVGHAYVHVLSGQPVEKMKIHLFYLEQGEGITKHGIGWMALAALAGPLVSALIGLISLVIMLHAKALAREVFWSVAFTNLMLAGISLLPIIGFDGGHMIFWLVVRYLGWERVWEISYLLSFLTIVYLLYCYISRGVKPNPC